MSASFQVLPSWSLPSINGARSPTLGTGPAPAVKGERTASQATASTHNVTNEYILINVLLPCSWCHHRRQRRLWQVGESCFALDAQRVAEGSSSLRSSATLRVSALSLRSLVIRAA